MELKKGGLVQVEAQCDVPEHELVYLRQNIQNKVDAVLEGSKAAGDAYTIKVVITKYDEGNAFARFMLIGLGQMYFHAEIEVTAGRPPATIRSGSMEKQYCVGGLIGGSATMHDDILEKVGQAIADAIKEQP